VIRPFVGAPATGRNGNENNIVDTGDQPGKRQGGRNRPGPGMQKTVPYKLVAVLNSSIRIKSKRRRPPGPAPDNNRPAQDNAKEHIAATW